MSTRQRATEVIQQVAQSEPLEQFRLNATDFLSARERGGAAGTRIDQMMVSMEEAAEVVNRSFPQRDNATGQYTNVISPVVIPKHHRSYLWAVVAVALALLGVFGFVSARAADAILGSAGLASAVFGVHYWLVLAAFVAFNVWRNSYVMVPDGSQALITRFGKLEAIVGPGRTWLLNPWKRVSYIVNTTREYPYNAPIREAPTSSRVNASVDLFLQFKIEDPAQFIFVLGGAKGFSEKLENAISEVTRALIYEQRAEDIYDLVGETTQSMIDSLNQQFLPAVRFVNANITHAEPSSQEYRIDLAAPEMVRVAKEAYTYQYELKVRKEQDEGDLNRELASLHETLSGIRAEIATFQAQIDTSREKETYRANAYTRQLLSEAESAAKANAALLEAQALDIRAVSSAAYPEILQYRFQQDVLDKMEAVADHLPQMVLLGSNGDQQVDMSQTARRMLGIADQNLYNENDITAIRGRIDTIKERIAQRNAHLAGLMQEAEAAVVAGKQGATE